MSLFYHNWPVWNEKCYSAIEIACFLLCSTLCPEMFLGMVLLIHGSLTKHSRYSDLTRLHRIKLNRNHKITSFTDLLTSVFL